MRDYRAPRKIQIFVGVATGFQWFQAFQVRNMAINRGALSLELVQRIKEEYKGLFELFSSDSLLSNLVVVITPVQTVGSVVFSRIETKNGEPYFRFRKVGHDARYSPKDSEQPLRYLLRFLLKLHLTNNRNWGFLNFIRDVFRMDNHLVNAIRELSIGCKSSGGFEILQGDHWLNL
jgi:hypothetical protein